MEEAQDMFRNANKVTRPEKALILGFMAGSRGNFIILIIFLFFMFILINFYIYFRQPLSSIG